jgi:molybdate transport system ATP-binding protein
MEGLHADIGLTIGPLDLDLEIDARADALVVLVGPNGAGKTTALRAIAGLLPIERGRISLDGHVLDDPDGGVFVEPEQRPVAVVFQEGLLFPHLSALENVAFGLRSRSVARDDARARARAWLERVGLGDRAGAKPRELSGGQQQRVALARALVTEPKLLLLDEPLAALDATTRAAMRREVRRHLREYRGVRLLVTHDPVEALSLGDQLVVVENGRVVQQGPPDALRRHPRSRYVADLVGVNLVTGDLDAGILTTSSGAALHVANPDRARGHARATVHPRAVALHRERPDGTPRNVWPATLTDVDIAGDRVRVFADGPVPLVAEITAAARDALHLEPGAAVWVAVKASEIDVQPD